MNDTILTQATDHRLALAVEENLFALFRAMAAALPNGQITETEQLAYHLAFPSNPMYKGIWRTRLTETNADAVIDQTLNWFKEQDAPFAFWWTGPRTTPDDLGKRLIERGLISFEGQVDVLAPGIRASDAGAPGMAADLHQMNEEILKQVPAGFVIHEVETEQDLLDFRSVLMAGYDMPDWAAQGWVDAALNIGIRKTPWKMYLGRLDGQPVASHILMNGGGVAGVFGIATIPSARGKGIGAAITLQPLLEAREMGYRYGVLFTSEMGKLVYERIGFRLVDCHINRYFWRNG